MFAPDTSSSNSINNNNNNYYYYYSSNSNQVQRPQSPRPSADCAMTPSSPSPSCSSPRAASEEMALDCIFCLSSMPADKPPLTGFGLLAQLVPCQHFMHNECLKPWTEIANTCPICRVSFNQVNVVPNLTGIPPPPFASLSLPSRPFPSLPFPSLPPHLPPPPTPAPM